MNGIIFATSPLPKFGTSEMAPKHTRDTGTSEMAPSAAEGEGGIGDK